ncbi:MAG: aminoglycoside phosphotransferase family protein [Verrucomicrobia bacterium]|nr:aminoglycoside phosphotransferase family protein [Verrucomicrobiota bacterium]
MDRLIIDVPLVRRLVDHQFPQWKGLSIFPVAVSGWDNRTFHLGENMIVRMPSAAEYALQVEKEQKWLPKLAPSLPVSIPTPLAIGEPGESYPWKWSIYRWLEGESAASAPITDLSEFAVSLAHFLNALQSIDASGGPAPGLHSFYRGGSLSTYDAETRKAMLALSGQMDVDAITEVWVTALATSWNKTPVWVHGDVSEGNLLIKEGRLSSVIDFGQLAVGDPACDLAMTWTFFKGKSRQAFRQHLLLDDATWARGRGWALWKALIVAAGFKNPHNAESAKCWHIMDEVLADYKR